MKYGHSDFLKLKTVEIGYVQKRRGKGFRRVLYTTNIHVYKRKNE